MGNRLINTADLTALVKENTKIEAIARSPTSDIVEGYLLFFEAPSETLVLSTYLSDKPRLFKRSDALLKEAGKMGLSSVRFELKNATAQKKRAR